MGQTKILPFRLFTAFSISFLIGIGLSTCFDLSFTLNWPIFCLLVCSLLLAALINYLLKIRYLSITAFCFLSCLFGLSYYSFFNSKTFHDINIEIGQPIEAKVIHNPERTFSKQSLIVLLPNNKLAQVNFPSYPRIEYTDTLRFNGKLAKPSNDYNQANILKGKRVGLIIQNPSNLEIIKPKLTFKEKIYQNLFFISELFQEILNKLLPEPHASLANGLLLGIKANMPDDYKTALSQTGLTHLIALSGYNVTIIITALSTLLLGFLNRKWVFLTGLSTVILFVILTGASSSIVRAAIFSMALIFGRTVGRKAYTTNILLLAALVMVLLNPFVLRYDLGFQLSFLAFAGIIYVSPILRKYSEKEKFHLVPEVIKATLVETLSAQLMVFPLILFVFGNVSLISPLANLLILWIVPITMLLCFITGLIGILFYPLGKFIALICWPFLNYIVALPTFLAKIPFASFQINNISWLITSLIYVLFLICLKFSYVRGKISL